MTDNQAFVYGDLFCGSFFGLNFGVHLRVRVQLYEKSVQLKLAAPDGGGLRPLLMDLFVGVAKVIMIF